MEIDLSDSFINERNRKRVEKQFSRLPPMLEQRLKVKAFHHGLKIDYYVKLYDLHFTILLAQDYPFSIPQVLLKSQINSKVSLNDHRNLIFDILKSKWGPAILLDNILSGIDEFCQELTTMTDEKLAELGTFNEEQIYYTSHINQSTSLMVFRARMVILNKGFLWTTKDYEITQLGLSESYFLIFNLYEEKENTLKLKQSCHFSQTKLLKQSQVDIVASLNNKQMSFTFETEVLKEAFIKCFYLRAEKNPMSLESTTFNAILCSKRIMKVQAMLEIIKSEQLQTIQHYKRQLQLYSQLAQLQSALHKQDQLKTTLTHLKHCTSQLNSLMLQDAPIIEKA